MHGYIRRKLELALEQSMGRAPVTAIIGPRQCGKSTIAKEFLKAKPSIYLDLQNRAHLNMLNEPELLFDQHRDETVCLDEIQLLPDFFSILRSEVDQDRRPGRFLILGSASRDLIRQSTETLAGRISYLDLTPFLLSEVESLSSLQQHWNRGGFPDSLLASDDDQSFDWRSDFVRTFLERDIPSLGLNIPVPVMHRLWRMLAHYHGQTLNYSKLAEAMDLSVPTLKKYLATLEQTFMIRLLEPCETNLKKRLIKSPKVYIRDSGLLHNLLDIDDFDHLLAHIQVGASWEGYCLENIIPLMPRWRPSFIRTSNGAEVDLVMERAGRRIVFEFKASKAPKPSRGFHEILGDLSPESAWIIAPVDGTYEYKTGVHVTNPSSLAAILDGVRKKGKS